jgi:dihydrofolate synthase/folylpolyglutamate synthase
LPDHRFTSLDQAYAWLNGHVDLERRLHAARHDEATFGLERFRRRLEALGDPQRGLRTIHIAGTRGKGSAALALEALLRAGGQRTAVFTSPHIREYRERIRIDGAPIEPGTFLELLGEVAAVAGPNDAVGHPTGFKTVFENLTALFLLAARRAGVDWAVVETGLGGRLDATNVLDPGPVLLTRIGLEHQHLLGTTLRQIAGEKAAILKRGGWGVVGRQAPATGDDPGAEGVFRARGAGEGAPLWGAEALCPILERELYPEGQRLRLGFDDGELTLGLRLLGTFVAENLQNALAMLAILRKEGRVPPTPPDAIVRSLQNLSLHGRMERVCRSPLLIVDAAHCPTGAEALAASMAAHFGEVRQADGFDLLVGMMVDKDHAGFLTALARWPGWRRVICYRPEGERALDSGRLAESARRIFDDVKVFTDLNGVLQFLDHSDEKNDKAVGAGTLYSVAALQDWGIEKDHGHGCTVQAIAPTQSSADSGNP